MDSSPTQRYHWENIENARMTIPASKLREMDMNLACHNLCTTTTIPTGTERTLGLGMNYCLCKPHPVLDQKKTVDRFCRDIRLQYMYRNDDDDDDDYNPSLNIKSNFVPPPSDNEQLEEALDRFGNEIGKLYPSHSNGRGGRPTNLDAQQLDVIQQLRRNDKIIVCEADKNLGPCTIERSTYIERALKDHLLDEKTYRRLTEEEASIHLKKVQYQVGSLVLRARKEGLASAELKYLNRALQLVHRMPQFYLLMKIHKTPWKTRPVVSTCGSLCYFLGKWVDYHLQPVAKLVPTYIRDSEELMTKLKQLGPLDPRAKLFTTDAVSMYTNIDTDHALKQLKVAFDRLKDKLSPDFPADLVLEALSIIIALSLLCC